MSRFRSRWPSGRVVLPVIHSTSTEQVLRNVEVAVGAGADGAFLIDHADVGWGALLGFWREAKARFPGFWLGVNCLDRSPTWVASWPEVEGMWSDNAFVFERSAEQLLAGRIRDAVRDAGWDGVYFGGVAFKGQRKVLPDWYGEAAAKATPYVDVVTTSGPGTGMPAEVGKVRAMREAVGDSPIALASGVTPGNVADYLPFVDAFLVASGISRDFEDLDPDLTRSLVDRVRSG